MSGLTRLGGMTHSPPDTPTKQFVIHRLLPGTPFGDRVEVHDGLHVPVAAAMSKGVVQHRAGTQGTEVLN